jgi:ATP synthase F1 gamma subunit
MATIVMLTNAFEGLASMRIAQVRTQVLQSQQYFAGIWRIYQQLRVDNLFRYGRMEDNETDGIERISRKELFVAVTAEGGFSGDIDHRLITRMRRDYDPKKHDLIVIGHHGALQLTQAGVPFTKYFKLPERNSNINIQPLVAEVRRYRSVVVYYQTYVSLMTQEIQKIELSKAIEDMGSQVLPKDEEISEKSYIFEPSAFGVVAHMERAMLEITLSQVILDSKLAQYASRFRAMRVANERAVDEHKALHTAYNRSKRAQSDERLKEIINGLKKAGAAA